MSNKEARKDESQERKGLQWILWVTLLVLSAGIVYFSTSENEQKVLKPSPKEVELVNNLFTQVNPAISENWYMPELMRSKLAWLLDGIEAGRIEVDYDLASEWLDVKEALFISTYSRGKPKLVIILDKLLSYIRVNGELPESITRSQKNSFAAALVHEAIHLERDLEWFKNKAGDPEERKLEEFRAYSQVDQSVIGPLRDIGEPLDKTHETIHGILVGCGYQLPCPTLMKYIGIETN